MPGASSSTLENEAKEKDTSLVMELQPVFLQSAPTQDITWPDGGLRAWLSVLGGFLITFCTFGASNSFGVYQSLYTQSGAGTPSAVSWIGSLQLCLMFAMGLVSGKLFDEGYFHHILAVGTVLYSFSVFMLSLASPENYYQLILAQGIASGIGAGLLLVPASIVQTHFWKKRRAFAMGIVLTGTSIGGIVFPTMLNQLFFFTGAGFAWGVRAEAFLILGLLVIANCIMTTRLPSVKQRPPGPKPNVKSILTDPSYMMLCLGTFVVFLGLFFPYFYLQVFAEAHGLSSRISFYSVAILNAGSIPGRLVPNMLADTFGNLNLVIPMSFSCSVLVFVMFAAKTEGALVVFALLYGFFSGAFVSLLPPALATLALSMDEIGIRMGMGYFLTSFAILVGTPIDGAQLGSGFKWYEPIVWSGVVMFVGSVLFIYPRHTVAKRRNTQFV